MKLNMKLLQRKLKKEWTQQPLKFQIQLLLHLIRFWVFWDRWSWVWVSCSKIFRVLKSMWCHYSTRLMLALSFYANLLAYPPHLSHLSVPFIPSLLPPPYHYHLRRHSHSNHSWAYHIILLFIVHFVIPSLIFLLMIKREKNSNCYE